MGEAATAPWSSAAFEREGLASVLAPDISFAEKHHCQTANHISYPLEIAAAKFTNPDGVPSLKPPARPAINGNA
jgi:hypothetical protein